jgi:O-antigen ligase
VQRSTTADIRPDLVVDDLIDVACIAVTAAVAVAVAIDERGAIRAVAALAFTLFVPGRCIVSNWSSMAARSLVAASVLLSLAILTLVATVALWMNVWRPLGMLEVDCAIATTALFAAILRRRWKVRTQSEITMKTQQGE